MSSVTIPSLHMEESEVFITFQLVENEPDTIMAKRDPSKQELDISQCISSNQLHHSEDPGLVGEGAPVRPRVVGGGGEREGLVPHQSEDLGLVVEGAPVRPRVAGGGGGGEREGLAPHHSEDLGLVGEGAPVRPRVAGGGGGGDREGQEDPGHHEDSFMD